MSPSYLTALAFLDYIGIGVFALSGALLAAQKRQDVVTFVFFAVVAGIGGGTTRDLLIGAPVFWIDQNWILLICLTAALLVWFTPMLVWGGRGTVWADAVGIAVYATYGAAKGLAYGVAPIPAIGMGVVTACLGVSFAMFSLVSLRSCYVRSCTSALPRCRLPYLLRLTLVVFLNSLPEHLPPSRAFFSAPQPSSTVGRCHPIVADL